MSAIKFLSPRIHGYFDYALVALFALAPTLFGFGGLPATLCYVLAAAQFGMSLMTAYPLGIAKVIPFRVHEVMEIAVVGLLVAAPWIFGFSDVSSARNFFLVTGIATAGLVLVTNYKAANQYLSSWGHTPTDRRTYA